MMNGQRQIINVRSSMINDQRSTEVTKDHWRMMNDGEWMVNAEW
jgi:hypothetical protein